MPSAPTRVRMRTDERREHLVRVGVGLLRDRPYDQLSIDDIAVAAGISKGLLYHYFPSKRDFLLEVVRATAAGIREATTPDPTLSPLEQLQSSIDGFIDFAQEHARGYAALFSPGAGGDAEIAALMDESRELYLAGLFEALEHAYGLKPGQGSGSPALRTAMQGYLSFVEGAVLRWLERRELARDDLRRLLVSAYAGSVRAALELDPKLGTKPGRQARVS
jgi:AcrR family transcriptional regulator